MAKPVLEFGIAPLITGRARGALLATSEPISFWGGTDPSGCIIDKMHPCCGQSLAGRVVALPSVKGSTAGPGALAELIMAGCGPVAILMSEVDMGPLVCAKVIETISDHALCVGLIEANDLEKLCSLAATSAQTFCARVKADRCQIGFEH